MSRLQAVSEREVPDQAQQAPAASPNQQVATQILFMALRALSQRFVVALANLFTLATVGSVFYLWLMAMDNMTVLRIIGLSIYAVFILLVNRYGRAVASEK